MLLSIVSNHTHPIILAPSAQGWHIIGAQRTPASNEEVLRAEATHKRKKNFAILPLPFPHPVRYHFPAFIICTGKLTLLFEELVYAALTIMLLLAQLYIMSISSCNVFRPDVPVPIR